MSKFDAATTESMIFELSSYDSLPAAAVANAGLGLGSLTLQEAHNAVLQAGGRPSRLGGTGFSFSSSVCHGGNSPAGCWASLHQGRVVLHCHRCSFPTSADNIRARCGLPAWDAPSDKPGFFPDSSGALAPIVRRWDYRRVGDGAQVTQVLRYQPAGLPCSFKDCGKSGSRHKHPWLEPRGVTLDGFKLRAHRLSGSLPTSPVLPPAGVVEEPEPLYILEGQDAADKAAALGMDAYSYVGGSPSAGKADYSVASGRRVLIHPDNDLAGAKAAAESAVAALKAGALSVGILPAVRRFKGADLADLPYEQRRSALLQTPEHIFLSAPAADLHLAIQQFRGAVAEKEFRPFIWAGRKQHVEERANLAWEGLRLAHQRGDADRLHSRGGVPVVLRPDGPEGYTVQQLRTREDFLHLVGRDCFWYSSWAERVFEPLKDELSTVGGPGADPALEAAAAWLRQQRPSEGARVGWRPRKDGTSCFCLTAPEGCLPSGAVVSCMMKRPPSWLEPLHSVTPFPHLRKGKLDTAGGFHPETGVFVNAAAFPDLVVPDIRESVRLLRELFSDFPFVDEADLSGTVAHCLTPMVRGAIGGKAPMTVYTKVETRTGASLLTDVVSTVLIGDYAYGFPYVGDSAEMSKCITSVLLSAAPLIRLDNVNSTLRDRGMLELATSCKHGGRLLGHNQHVVLDARQSTWCLTGNAVLMCREFLNRTQLVRLDADVQHPWERHGPAPGREWRFPDPIENARENRGVYLGALCGLIQHWLDSGSPLACLATPLGGFERWAAVVGGILQCAGFGGFMQNREDMITADEDEESADELAQAWFNDFGFDSVRVASLMTTANLPVEGKLAEGYPVVDLQRVNPRALGGWLRRHMLKRRFRLDDGTMVKVVRKAPPPGRGNGYLWALTPVEEPEASCPTAGTVVPDSVLDDIAAELAGEAVPLAVPASAVDFPAGVLPAAVAPAFPLGEAPLAASVPPVTPSYADGEPGDAPESANVVDFGGEEDYGQWAASLSG